MLEKLKLLGARVLRTARPYRFSIVLLGVALFRLLRRGQRVRAEGEEQKHIVVVRLDAIGDLVMSSFIFKELKLRFPGSFITAVVQQQSQAILETNPYVDRILSPSPTHKSRFLREFRQDLSVLSFYREHLMGEEVDIAVNPRMDSDLYSAGVLLKLMDARQSYKYEDTFKKSVAASVERFVYRGMVEIPAPGPQHEVLSNIAITERITGRVCHSRPQLFLTEADLAHSDGLLAGLRPDILVISMSFTAQAKRRVWPLERWAETIRLLSLHRDVYVLLICAKSEEPLGKQLQSMVSVPSRSICGATLRQVAANIKASDLFLGLDSGLAHLAAAVNCASVIVSPHPLDGDLCHGNSPVRFGPFSDRTRVIQPEHGLSPCVTGCDAITPHCILQVEAEQVAEACESLLVQLRSSKCLAPFSRANG